MKPDAKAITIGSLVFAIGLVAVTFLPMPFEWLIFSPAFFAGAVTAYLLRDKRIYPLLVLACVAAALSGALSLVLTPFHMTDFPGWRASFVATLVSLPFTVGLVLFGGAIVGVWQRARHA